MAHNFFVRRMGFRICGTGGASQQTAKVDMAADPVDELAGKIDEGGGVSSLYVCCSPKKGDYEEDRAGSVFHGVLVCCGFRDAP